MLIRELKIDRFQYWISCRCPAVYRQIEIYLLIYRGELIRPPQWPDQLRHHSLSTTAIIVPRVLVSPTNTSFMCAPKLAEECLLSSLYYCEGCACRLSYNDGVSALHGQGEEQWLRVIRSQHWLLYGETSRLQLVTLLNVYAFGS